MTLADIDTPALIVDLAILERNLSRVADYAAGHGLGLRPHTKTHKSPALARRQLGLGANGLTVAKVGEAEVMLAAAPPELLVAYPVIGERKLARLMAVAARTRVLVALDSAEAAAQLSRAAAAHGLVIGVLVEVDAGLHRVGLPTDEDAIALARQVGSLPGLRFQGLTFYPGHLKQAGPEMLAGLEQLGERLGRLRAQLEAAGLPCPVVSGGSTPTLWQSHRMGPALTEIRPGTSIFNDRNTVLSGACGWEDCAVSLLCTVVSTAVPGQFIIDGGSKTFSSDKALGAEGHGQFPDLPAAALEKMNEEHGFVRYAGARPAVGQQVRVIPNHVCVTINLQDRAYGVRDGVVEEVFHIEARGKLQ